VTESVCQRESALPSHSAETRSRQHGPCVSYHGAAVHPQLCTRVPQWCR
jgi:hypothetical protein